MIIVHNYFAIKNIYIEVTDKCNMLCEYCYNQHRRKSIDIEVSYIQDLIFSLHNLAGNSVGIILSGGEFFLHKKWRSILDICDKYDLYIVTNGTLISSRIVHILKNKRVKLVFSLDSLNQGYSLRSNVDIVKRNIEIASKHVATELKVCIHRLNANRYELERMCQYANELDVDLSFDYIHGTMNGTNYELSGLEKQNVKRVIKHLVQKYPNVYADGIDAEIVCPLLNNARELSPKVTPNGDVFICQFAESQEMCIGNIYNSSFIDLVDVCNVAKSLKKIEDVMCLARQRNCTQCLVKNTCGGGCPAIYLVSKDSYLEMCEVIKEELNVKKLSMLSKFNKA